MLIVVEGVDGAGKSASSKLLKEKLEAQYPGQEVVSCRAPDGPIREVLLNRPEGTTIDHETELLLFVTCHRWLLINKVLPALARGAIVVLDRFTDSTIAYQGGGRRLGMQYVVEMLSTHVFTPFGAAINPDLRIYIEADEAIRENRLAERATASGLDHMDKQGLEFRRRNQDVMRQMAYLHEDNPNHIHGKTMVMRVKNNSSIEELEATLDHLVNTYYLLEQTAPDREANTQRKLEEINEKLAYFLRH